MSKKYYNSKFYEDRSDSLTSAEEIVPYLLEITKAKSVVDIGCGDGVFLSIFKKAGIKNILGIDGDWVEDKFLKIPKDSFLTADFEQPFEIDKTYDLAMTLEVAEHISKESAKDFVTSMTKLAPVILFSAAIPHQGGTHHVNEQWPEYWVKLFKDENYLPIDCLREKFWNNPNVSYWYAQNMLLFVRKDFLQKNQELNKIYEESPKEILSLVHPIHFMQKARIWALVWNLVPNFIKEYSRRKK